MKAPVLLSWLILASSAVAQLPGAVGITAAGKEVHFSGEGKAPWLADMTKVVGPSYPYHDRYIGNEGSGRYRLLFDVKTGAVSNVLIVKRAGYDSLDTAAVDSFRQWRARPGTWRSLEIPVTWLVASRGDYYRVERYKASLKRAAQ